MAGLYTEDDNSISVKIYLLARLSVLSSYKKNFDLTILSKRTAETLKQNQAHYITLFSVHFAAGEVHIPYTYHLRRSFSLTAYILVRDLSKDGAILAYDGVIDGVLVSVQSGKLVIQRSNNSKYCIVKA